MTKKRQNSIISSSSNSNNDTTSKENENKGSFSPPSLNVVTNSSPTSSSSQSVVPNKAQISLLKIAASTSSSTPSTATAAATVSKSSKVLSTFIKKDSMSATKKKILRENVTAATALANNQHNLHHNHHQIPHKKIRVSGIAGSNPNNPNVVAHSVEKDSFESDLIPCCSRSIPAFSIYTKAPSSPSSGSASSSNSGQVKVTSFMPIKKVGVTKFTSKTLGVSGKKSRSENVVIAAEASTVPTFQTISEKLIKKKKRLLAKSDTTGTLKRKKSRPQKPLV